MEHLVTIFGVYQYSNLAHVVTHVPFGQWCMKTSRHSFSVHGVSSSLPLSQQGPDGLPMPGCWQKVRWTNTEWNVCHFKHGASCLQCEQNKVTLKNDFQVLVQFKGIWRARSNSFENRQRNWKCYKTEQQNMPQIQKTQVSLLDFIVLLVLHSRSFSTAFSCILQFHLHPTSWYSLRWLSVCYLQCESVSFAHGSDMKACQQMARATEWHHPVAK